MRLLAAAAVMAVAVLSTSAVPASARVGEPGRLHVASLAGDRTHPGARTEEWTLTAFDRRSDRALVIRLRRPDVYSTARVFLMDGPGLSRDVGVSHGDVDYPGSRAVSFPGPTGSTSVRWSRRVLRIALAGGGVEGTLRLRGRPGPGASRWRLPEALDEDGRRVAQDISWTAPVGDGRLRGTLRVEDRTVDVDGWRASWSHVWGSAYIDAFDPRWELWDRHTLFDRRGAWLAFGLNRDDTVYGEGARDGQHLAVLARVTRRGVRMCRPHVLRADWYYRFPETYGPFASRWRYRCTGLRTSMSAVGPHPGWDDTGTYLRVDGSRTRGPRGAVGAVASYATDCC